MTPASKQWSMLIANYITHAATNVHLCKSRKKLKKNQPQACCRADHRAHHH
jgi:hypothetical protein